MKISILFFAFSISIFSQINEIKIFNLPDEASRSASTIQASNGDLLTIWSSGNKLYLSRSSNNGDDWSLKQLDSLNYDFECIRAFKTSSERILLLYKNQFPYLIYSDDDGQTWSSPVRSGFKIRSYVSSNDWQTWSDKSFLFSSEFDEKNIKSIITSSGKAYLVFEHYRQSIFDGIPQSEIAFVSSTDNGINWSDVQYFSSYKGEDVSPHLSLLNNDKILASFLSNRYIADRENSTLLFGILEESLDNNTPPYLYTHNTSAETPEPNEEINVKVFIDYRDDSIQVYFINKTNLMEPDSVRIFDDGMNGDSSANDRIFGAIINGIKTGDILSYNFSIISPDYYVRFNGGEMFIPIPRLEQCIFI